MAPHFHTPYSADVIQRGASAELRDRDRRASGAGSGIVYRTLGCVVQELGPRITLVSNYISTLGSDGFSSQHEIL
jgi:hypothetical protein